MRLRPAFCATLSAAALLCAPSGVAQRTQPEPPTDTAAQSSPTSASSSVSAVDASQQASPIRPLRSGAAPHVAPHTAIHLRLSRGIDSGHLKNGDNVPATLADPLPLTTGGSLPAGTPVELTVVETLPAGRIYAAGEFSLQVLRIGRVPVYTNTLTFRGKPGHKDLPDSAPAVGTDAGLPAAAALTFHVLSPPAAASGPPTGGRHQPGSVNGVASGGAPPPGSAQHNATTTNRGNTTGNAGVKTVTPATNTPGPPQNQDQSSPAPNQPAPPTNATPAGQTQPK